MSEARKQFMEALERRDKAGCVSVAIQSLQDGSIDVLGLFQEWLVPALENWQCPFTADPSCIYFEHIRTEIVKSVLENAYPYILDVRKKQVPRKARVAVLCPWEEFHDVAARMVANWFDMKGYPVTFVGSNTPLKALRAGLEKDPVDILALSVTNPYHISETIGLIDSIKGKYPSMKVIVGGQAFSHHRSSFSAQTVDAIIKDFHDLEAWEKQRGNG
ncbi:MAG TPA: cobalamin B12-binding domain-containing protein [Thermotogota bacterium]|nr:cobalamin B12-binding domain-containing protein [Thermotogota bacterium]HRW93529.1 cobalamin B12-binding domain-containing protein [Thermotogota bacterium]